ncbi:MAG: hypothetical protein P1V81_03985 [Planctomycetota bacterium]|nr:hypothetical protein [Planctomycetota bacterium]
MSLAKGMEALSLDQAPPLSIPFLFFATAPVALLLAGLLLVARGGEALATAWRPDTLVLTHLGTIGFLGSVMFGALYQMSPVVAVATVPRIRHAYLVWGLNAVGLVMLVAWGARGVRADLGSPWLSFHFIATGVMLFALFVGWALFVRSRTPGPTVWGMRLAVLALFTAMTLGTFMVGFWGGGSMLSDRTLALEVHLSFAILGWIGGLITAGSWQVLPMFYLTPGVKPERSWLVLLTLAGSLFGVLCVVLLDAAGQLAGAGRLIAAILVAPAAVAVWVVHPFLVWGQLRHRKRKRIDPSARFWQVGMGFGVLTLFLATSAVLRSSDWYGLAFVWCALLGWAGLIVHGMLTRIGPFLIWFHRFSPYVGRIPVPAIRRMLPDKLVWSGLGLHVATVVLGLVAITFHIDLVARLAGLCLALLACVMGTYLVILLCLRPDTSSLDG